MALFILSLWVLSLCLTTLFHVGVARNLIDATGLTCLIIVIGYLLTIFYENLKHRTYINWMQIKSNETKREGL
jgi:hypothetical protein